MAEEDRNIVAEDVRHGEVLMAVPIEVPGCNILRPVVGFIVHPGIEEELGQDFTGREK